MRATRMDSLAEEGVHIREDVAGSEWVPAQGVERTAAGALRITKDIKSSTTYKVRV